MTHAYELPNFCMRYDGYRHNMSFRLNCDGLTVAPGWRLGAFSKEQINAVVAAMELLGLLFGAEYAPSWIRRPDGDVLQFKTIDVDYRTFRRRFKERITPAKREALLEDGMPKQFVHSPYTAYRAIWTAFWLDAYPEDKKSFLDALSRVYVGIESEEDK